MSSPSRKCTKKKSIQRSDPGKLLDLVMSLTDDACAQIQIKINSYLARECEAELAFQIIVNTERLETFVEAIGETALSRKTKITVPKVMDTLKSNMEKSELLCNFSLEMRTLLDPYTPKDNAKRRVILFPVQGSPFAVIFLVIAPKLQQEHVAIIVYECSMFCWPTLQKSITLEYECTLKQKCQQLLRVARRLFTQVASLETLLKIAIDQAKLLTQAGHCTVLLVDVEKMELYEACSHIKSLAGVDIAVRRFPIDIGITGEVIRTGTLVNSKSPKEHPAFNPTVDCIPEVECKNLLFFPIREQSGIIGVGQLINKIGDPYFDAMDEEMALAFSIYCGMCIIHSVMYTKIQEAHVRNALANELVMYHMKVTDGEVHNMLECQGFHNHPQANSLHFNFRVLPLRELPCYVLKIFVDLGFDKRFKIRHSKLCRFILHVKKGYRDVPYHNWLHAFTVVQWAYAAIVNFKLISSDYISELQGLMYIVAAMMHDLDHRGTTNNFQIQGHTTLAALYSSEGSVMERHHIAQAMCILNTEGCDILECLPRKDFDRAIMMLRDYILATDLATYFKNKEEYYVISMDFQKGNKIHQTTLLSLLMIAADLSDELKDWNSVKKTAGAILTEFYRQGEVEKSRGDIPEYLMDSEKCFIPNLEVNFLQDVCIPLYQIIGNILPKALACIQILESHIEHWDAAKQVFAEVPISSGLAVLLSPELDSLIEINIQEKQAEMARLAEEAGNEEAYEETQEEIMKI